MRGGEGLMTHQHKKGYVVPKRYEVLSEGKKLTCYKIGVKG